MDPAKLNTSRDVKSGLKYRNSFHVSVPDLNYKDKYSWRLCFSISRQTCSQIVAQATIKLIK
jgi:hypothetical protein